MQYVQIKFKELRKQSNMTQAEIAEKLGIQQQAWARLETGKVPDPRASTIVHICKELGVSANWLLGLEE